MSAPRVVSVYKKYTVGSVGIWEKIRRFFAVDPNRSTGVPLNGTFRYPAPGSQRGLEFTDPVTIPAGDIAENPYWKRDVRRNYARTAVFKQSDIAGLLTLGNKEAPRIAKGKEGENQLVAVKQQEGILAKVIEENGKLAAKDVLKANGLPPLPGFKVTWKEGDQDASYPKDQYPCRVFA
ncbi:NADH-ubiquinone oxidoreductase 21.3 kDa subunit [Pyronema omphalodes]|nr:NADH-ubiquinone oxidoreductase 21.3 kDa subunit [Pyronema omphalodes]